MDQINGLAAEPWDERPRDVFLGACASVAAGLAADGFSYARSGPRATRRDGPWKFALWFQSGRIGTYFAIHYLIHNKDFLAWRKQFAARAGQPDLVVSMNLGFLSPIGTGWTSTLPNLHRVKTRSTSPWPTYAIMRCHSLISSGIPPRWLKS